MSGGAPQIVLATDGDPRGRGTWSGSSRALVAALERRGALAGAVDVKPRALDALERVASFSPDGVRWRQRYRACSSPLSPFVRAAMTRVGARRVARVEATPDVLLQISGWYDVRAGGRVRPRIAATFQDANLALWRRRPDIALDPDDRHVQRTLAAEGRVYRSLDVVFTMSEWARRSFVEDFGLDPGRVVAIGAGANLDPLPQPASPATADPPRLLFLGRKWERKGGPELLDAFARLRASRPGAQLDVVGPPPRPAPPGVTFHGPVFADRPGGRERLDALWSGARAFVLPTRYEGFGIPFLEAMAHGLPCVGTRVCAVPELVQDGVTGRLVEPGDVAGLAAAMGELLDDPQRAAAMGRAGRERFQERFTWDAVVAHLIEELDARIAVRRADADSISRR